MPKIYFSGSIEIFFILIFSVKIAYHINWTRERLVIPRKLFYHLVLMSLSKYWISKETTFCCIVHPQLICITTSFELSQVPRKVEAKQENNYQGHTVETVCLLQEKCYIHFNGKSCKVHNFSYI